MGLHQRPDKGAELRAVDLAHRLEQGIGGLEHDQHVAEAIGHGRVIGLGALQEFAAGAFAIGHMQAAGERKSDDDAAQQGQGGGDIMWPQANAADARAPIRHKPW